MKLDENGLRKALETLQRYKEGKARLEDRIVNDEQWWKLRHWEQMGGNTFDVKPTSAWLVNVIFNKHADAMDNYPEPICLPRERSDEQEANTLSKILPVVLEQGGYKQAWREAWWYKLKSGCGVYGVFWNSAQMNGLGDVEVRKMNVLNLFWEPGVADIQQSPHFFSVDYMDKEMLEERWPQMKGKPTTNGLTLKKFLYDDNINTENKALVIDWYYKEKGRVHLCKFCGNTILYATEQEKAWKDRGWYDDGKYPFVFDTLFPEEGTPCGYGYIDICKNTQAQIDLMNQAILKNALVSATPRWFIRTDGAVNEEEYADWTKPFVHTNGNLGEDSIREIRATPLSGSDLAAMTNKVQELRETSGNTEAYTGSGTSGVTAASGIAALQEASGKLSRDMIDTSYDAFRQVCIMVIDRIRQFYTAPRKFRITGELGTVEYTSYTNAGLVGQTMDAADGQEATYRTPVIDIDVKAQRESAYTRAEYNELALQLYGAGFFAPSRATEALAALSIMDFKGKEKVQQTIAKNNETAAMMQKMAQMLDMTHGTQIATAMEGQEITAPVGQSNVPRIKVDGQFLESTVTANARAQTQQATEVR